MSLAEVFRMLQAMELTFADVAYIKNKDTEDLHKIGTRKVQLRYKKKKGSVLGAVKNGTRDVYSVQHGEKLVLNVKKKKSFFETMQK